MIVRRSDRPVVLIVDDEDDVRFLLHVTLEHAGYQVEEAADGGAALEMIGRSIPDILVTDLMMPVVDGRELIAMLRSDPGTATLPIVLLTAHSGGSAADRLMRKPFDPSELVAAIQELMPPQ